MFPRTRVLAAVCAALTLPLLAQDIRITNGAAVARKQWVDVALPASDAAALPLLCRVDPHGWPAVKGSSVGVHSTLYHVYCDLAPGRSTTGRLIPVSNDPANVGAYGWTDWVADSTPGLLPFPAILDRAGVERRLTPTELVEVETNPVRKVFRMRGRMDGTPLAFEAFVYLYTHQDAVKFEVTFTNSDPRTPQLSYDFDLMWIEFGECPVIDWRHRLGLAPPFVQTSLPTHPSHGKWVQMLSAPRTIGRNEQLHFTGWLLCLPNTTRRTPLIAYQAGSMQVAMTEADRVQNLLATMQAPARGVSLDWQGKWLGFGLTPEVPHGTPNNGWNDANHSANAFATLLQSPADLLTQRPRGLNRRAATTGAQEDFGATKGAFAVTVGDPRYIDEMGYTVHGEMFLRPYHYREADATPLRRRNHPLLQTWSQFPNCRTTRDFVGLVCPLPYSWPSNGWSAFDDQHRSQNNFNALLALTGDWSLRSTLVDLSEVDQTQVPNRMDSPRGEGRLFIAWASMLLLLDDPQDRADLMAHMGRRISWIQNLWAGGQFVNDPSKPVRVLQEGSDPTFLEPNNTRVPAIIVWEHGIATAGLWAGYRVTGDTRMRDVAAEISKTIVNHCIFQDTAGAWRTCTAVRYLQGAQEGDALPSSSYYVGSPDVLVGTYSFHTWILPAVLVCRELHQHDAALVARCNAILNGIAPNGPRTWDESQWWAVLPW